MNLRKLLPIVVGVAFVWVVGHWMGFNGPEPKTVTESDSKASQLQSARHDRTESAYLGYGRTEEADWGAVDPADASFASGPNWPGGSATREDDGAPSEIARSVPEPVSEAPDRDEAADRDTGLAPDPSDNQTTLSISGWVQDYVGEPVAGIQVVATARQLFGAQGAGKPGAGQRRQNARSDNSGYFELPELADGEYAVSTEATPEYKSARAMLRAGADSAVLVVKGNADYKVNVSGTVSSSQGQPLTGVRVRAAGAAGAASSGADGRYALTLGIGNRDQSYSVRFRKKGYRTESRKLDQAALEDGGEIALDATLEPVEDTAVVDGRVADPAGAAISGARIRLSSSQRQRTYTTRSDKAGEFSFSEVDVGNDYRLWVRPRNGYEEYIEEPIDVAAGDEYLSVTLEPLENGTLVGQMIDADGRPVPGFTLWLRTASPSAQQYRTVTGDQRGQFIVEDLPQGEISFSTRSSPYLQITGMHFSPGYQDRVELLLDLGIHEASGYVLDGNDNPVGGARVSLTWSLAEGGVQSRSKRSTVTDGNGLFLFTQVGSGPHLLNVDASGYRPMRVEQYVSSGDDLTVRLQEDPS
jgi:protocatechuate 3,4-dioxygenase beta subunit